MSGDLNFPLLLSYPTLKMGDLNLDGWEGLPVMQVRNSPLQMANLMAAVSNISHVLGVDMIYEDMLLFYQLYYLFVEVMNSNLI